MKQYQSSGNVHTIEEDMKLFTIIFASFAVCYARNIVEDDTEIAAPALIQQWRCDALHCNLQRLPCILPIGFIRPIFTIDPRVVFVEIGDFSILKRCEKRFCPTGCDICAVTPTSPDNDPSEVPTVDIDSAVSVKN